MDGFKNEPVSTQTLDRNIEEEFFQGFQEEPEETINKILSGEAQPSNDRAKMVLATITSVIIIGLSFWGSFVIGKKLFSNNNAGTPKYIREEAFIPKTQISEPVQEINRIPAAEVSAALDNTPPPQQVVPVQAVTPIKIVPPAAKVNNPGAPVVTAKPSVPGEYKVIAGSFRSKELADKMAGVLRSKGYNPKVTAVNINNQGMFRVLVGDGLSRPDAQALKDKVKLSGYDVFLLN